MPRLLLSVSSPSSICHYSFAFQLLFRYFNFVITPAPIFFLYYCQCCTPFNTPWIKCIACASNPDFGLCMSVDQCLTSRSYVPQDTTILIAWILGSLRLRTPHESSPGFSHQNSLDLNCQVTWAYQPRSHVSTSKQRHSYLHHNEGPRYYMHRPTYRNWKTSVYNLERRRYYSN